MSATSEAAVKRAGPCPGCGSGEPPIHRGKRYALYPLGCLYVIGLPFAMLHQLSQPVLFECRSCGKRFGRRGLLAKISLVTLVAIVVALGWFLVALVVGNPGP